MWQLLLYNGVSAAGVRMLGWNILCRDELEGCCTNKIIRRNKKLQNIENIICAIKLVEDPLKELYSTMELEAVFQDGSDIGLAGNMLDQSGLQMHHMVVCHWVVVWQDVQTNCGLLVVAKIELDLFGYETWVLVILCSMSPSVLHAKLRPPPEISLLRFASGVAKNMLSNASLTVTY